MRQQKVAKVAKEGIKMKEAVVVLEIWGGATLA
jgi:hypothetical protein